MKFAKKTSDKIYLMDTDNNEAITINISTGKISYRIISPTFEKRFEGMGISEFSWREYYKQYVLSDKSLACIVAKAKGE